MFAALVLGVALSTPGRRRTPEYHKDIAPILSRHCNDCHGPKGNAPFTRLDSFEAVRSLSSRVKRYIANREKPFPGVDNTGFCGSWANVRWLSAEEIVTVLDWVEGGMPEGSAAPRAPQERPAPAPFRTDATFDIGGVFKPGFGEGGHRCFLVKGVDASTVLTAMRIDATDRRAIEQVALYALEDDDAVSRAKTLDAAQPGLGFHCYGTPEVENLRLVASWLVGDDVTRFPPGLGARLPGGRPLLVQVHYNIGWAGSEYASDLRVEAELDPKAKALRTEMLTASVPELPPRKRGVAVFSTRRIEQPTRLVAVAPQLHARGRTLQLTVDRGAADPTCLATFDHWHYPAARFVSSLTHPRLAGGEELRLSCAFQTLGTGTPVKFGRGSDEEECLAWVYFDDEAP